MSGSESAPGSAYPSPHPLVLSQSPSYITIRKTTSTETTFYTSAEGAHVERIVETTEIHRVPAASVHPHATALQGQELRHHRSTSVPEARQMARLAVSPVHQRSYPTHVAHHAPQSPYPASETSSSDEESEQEWDNTMTAGNAATVHPSPQLPNPSATGLDLYGDGMGYSAGAPQPVGNSITASPHPAFHHNELSGDQSWAHGLQQQNAHAQFTTAKDEARSCPVSAVLRPEELPPWDMSNVFALDQAMSVADYRNMPASASSDGPNAVFDFSSGSYLDALGNSSNNGPPTTSHDNTHMHDHSIPNPNSSSGPAEMWPNTTMSPTLRSAEWAAVGHNDQPLSFDYNLNENGQALY
ncbi:hypothetical protein EXIGLDRAFT_720815 [Exidia glandulosa HHB12029]|uniref:Uncharacterized protein n=1 Tax=Exidia glandulosa HHB12029 TaxID=1314781 RepID=A0A165G4Z5_EXIGL|nr:hypothetical protein EXIGLDRAFT_720815 [Exidia glandulosa HHB12029]